MKESQPYHKVNYNHLTGPFSPFTFALQDIRNKLIKPQDGDYNDPEKKLNEEYLEHIISLSIPLVYTNETVEAFIQFPIAACLRKEKNELLIRYSGQYEQYEDRKIVDESAPHDFATVYETIRQYIKNQTSSEELKRTCLEDIMEGSNAILAQYPQVIRQIKGFFHFSTDDTQFYIFISCQPVSDSKACGLCDQTSPCNIVQNIPDEDKSIDFCFNNVVDVFKNYFFSDDTRRKFYQLLGNVQQTLHKKVGLEYDKDPVITDYPILRDILSRIQEDALKLVSFSNKNNINEQKRRAFSTVFVLPSLIKDQLCFRYILTHEQVQFLRNLNMNKFETSIKRIEDNTLEFLLKEIKKQNIHSGKGLDNFEKIIIILQNIFQNDKKAKHGSIEEHLRLAILSNHTFSQQAKSIIKADPDLAKYMSSDASIIKYRQAFLLDAILKAKHPDIMVTMINHPYSKMIQYPTEKLLEDYTAGKTEETLYPAPLSLLELFVLHPPLFLNPIYQYGVPILLSAFDASLFSGHWQALKDNVESHIDGVFAAIVSHEQNEARKAFANSKYIMSLQPKEAANELAERLRYLTLRFCPNLDATYKAFKDGLKIEDDHGARCQEREINLPSKSGSGSINFPNLGKKLVLAKDIANYSATGKRHWKRYINMYLDDFLGSWELAESVSKYQREKAILGMKAAVAAIMGRNMSHNLGSHVLSYLVNDYNSLELEDNEGGLKSELMSLKTIFCKALEDHFAREYRRNKRKDMVEQLKLLLDASKVAETGVTVDDNLIKRFNNFIRNNKELLKYLKDRMDFIATILTFVPSPSTMNFRTNLMKFFYLDADRARNNSMDIKHFYNFNFILANIALSEKVCSKSIDRERIEVCCDGKIKEINLAIPGGVIGMQAFYSIIENIIRNAAKHGAMHSYSDKIIFTVDFPDEYSDNVVDYDKDDLARVTISDNLGNADDTLIKALQNKCDDSIIDSDGTFLNDMGFKEIKIAAAFLRGIRPDDIEKNTFITAPSGSSSKLLTIHKCTNTSDKGGDNLCHSFFVMKPKEILIITDECRNWEIVNQKGTKLFRKNGIDFVITGKVSDCNEVMGLNNFMEGDALSQKARHRFLILDVDNVQEFDLKRDFLPYRVITRDDQLKCLQAECNPVKLIHSTYKKWISKLSQKDIFPNLIIDKEYYDAYWRNYGINYVQECDVNNLATHKGGCIYINHFFGSDFKKIVKENKIEENRFADFMKQNKINSIDEITGRNSSKSKIETNGLDGSLAETLALEFLEAGITSVCIIDERFFKTFQKKKNFGALFARGISFYDLIMNNEMLEMISVDPCVSRNIKINVDNGELMPIEPPNGAKYYFLSIHQGIIDKIIDNTLGLRKNKNVDALKVLSVFKNMAEHIVVHSGRGKTAPVPKGFRFLNYPELESWLADDKHTLIQGFFGIRGR